MNDENEQDVPDLENESYLVIHIELPFSVIGKWAIIGTVIGLTALLIFL